MLRTLLGRNKYLIMQSTHDIMVQAPGLSIDIRGGGGGPVTLIAKPCQESSNRISLAFSLHFKLLITSDRLHCLDGVNSPWYSLQGMTLTVLTSTDHATA